MIRPAICDQDRYPDINHTRSVVINYEKMTACHFCRWSLLSGMYMPGGYVRKWICTVCKNTAESISDKR